MKNFVKENWYKLMVGSSMMMASFGFMIYAISPAYSKSNSDKTEIKHTNASVGTNGVIIDGSAFWCDGGYMYKCTYPDEWLSYGSKNYAPTKKKLP